MIDPDLLRWPVEAISYSQPSLGYLEVEGLSNFPHQLSFERVKYQEEVEQLLVFMAIHHYSLIKFSDKVVLRGYSLYFKNQNDALFIKMKVAA